MKRAILALALLAVACGTEDDCADRLQSGRPIPAEGCCTAGGSCTYPPVYNEACRDFAREQCAEAVYPPVYEGGPEWTFCPPLEGAPCIPAVDVPGGCAPAPTPCPIAWLG